MRSLGAYDLETPLGRGAQGVVYRARHRPTSAVRAVKVLEGVSDLEAVDRFRREAEALARVGGDGVVRVHEVGSEPGRLYYAMDLLAGGSLRERLARAGRLEWREAAALVAGLARTLERCAAAGLVHRDVKPENVLFDEDGRARLVDFGLARDLASRSLTTSGMFLGTPGYMAPEQLVGERAGAPADVFALGVVLHELLTGEVPFAARSLPDLHARIRSGVLEPASRKAGSPRELDGAIARALVVDPARRPRAGELAAELEHSLGSGKAAKPSSTRRGPVALVAAAILGALVVGAVVAWRRDGGPQPAPTPARSPLEASRSPGGTPRHSPSSSPTGEPADPAAELEAALPSLRQGLAGRAARVIAQVGTASLTREQIEAVASAAATGVVARLRPFDLSAHVDSYKGLWAEAFEAYRLALSVDENARPPAVLVDAAQALEAAGAKLTTLDQRARLDVLVTLAIGVADETDPVRERQAEHYAERLALDAVDAMTRKALGPERILAELTLATRALRKPGRRAVVQLARGRMLRAMRGRTPPRDLEAAIQALGDAVGSKGLAGLNRFEAVVLLARALDDAGRSEDAYRTLVDHWEERNPVFEAYVLRARLALVLRGDDEEARQILHAGENELAASTIGARPEQVLIRTDQAKMMRSLDEKAAEAVTAGTPEARERLIETLRPPPD